MLSSHLPGAANRLVRVSLIDSPLIFSSCKLWLQEEEATCQGRHGGPAGFRSAGVPGRWVSRFKLWAVWDKQPLPCAAVPSLTPVRGWGLSPTGGREGQVQTTASSARSFTSPAPCSLQDLFPSCSQPGRGAESIPKGMLLAQERRAACLPCLPSTHTARREDRGNRALGTGMPQGPSEVTAVPDLHSGRVAALPVPESWVPSWAAGVCSLAAFGQVALPAPYLSFPRAGPQPCFASVPLFPPISKPRQLCCPWLRFRGPQ